MLFCPDECLGLAGPAGRKAAADAVCNGRLLILGVETEPRCNLRCPFCREISLMTEGAQRLSLAEWVGVVEQGLDLGVKHVLIGGRGEPLGHEHTLPLIRAVRERGCSVELLTNGTRVSRQGAEELFELGVHVITKWDSRSPDVQDRLAGQSGAHEGIYDGRDNLLAAGYPGAGRRMGIKTVVSRHNIDEIPALWRWARERDIVPFVWRSIIGGSAVPVEEWAVSLQRTRELFEELSNIDSREYRSEWQAHPPWAGRSCGRLPYSLAVHADGVATPCFGLDLPVGTVRDASLRLIVRDSAVMSDLRDIRARIKGYCRICGQAEECYGCRASAYFHTGDYLASDPECWRRRTPDEGAERIDVEEKIPQKKAMCLIRGRAAKDDFKAVLSLTVPDDGIFSAPNKTLAPVALIEMLAQLCAASYSASKDGDDDSQVRGYMVGIDNVIFPRTVRAGDSLDLIIWNIIEFNEIHRIQGEVYRGESMVGQAELTLFETREWKEPPQGEDVPVRKKGSSVVTRFPGAAGDKDEVGRGILDSLLSLDVRPEESAEASLSFGPGFIGFSGHFPGYAVLPGVAILYVGWVLAEIFRERRLDLVSIRKAKFSKPIHPGDEVRVELKPLEDEKETQLWFSVKVMCGGELAARYEIGTGTKGENPE
ncbi:MAG: hypothetical protein A2Y86_01955 [Candidatus Aminicenantes bacterium RBG_13_62_12]|nr:MAG: hypothetical protein A2Y86_01955 [Candidatus Aminicenantes bacterium RBG_13_62_12]